MRVEFERVSLIGQKTVRCAGCGKRITRQRTFFQTINPWNKTADGRLKDREDIIPELRAEIARWQEEPELCKACEAKSTGR